MAKQTPYKMTKLSEITPYDRNPRIIPQAAVDAVAKSIQAFGFRQPIVVDGKGVILAGHTRYKAAVQLGLDEVPVVWQTDISEIQAKGYRIADNKTAEISAWDRDQLDKEVQEIAAECDFDVDSLGLAEWELHRILEKDTDITSQFDDAPKPSYTQAYSPYENGERSGGVVLPGKSHAISGTVTDQRRAVKIVFPTREALESAKELLDRAATENLGVITACDP